MTIASVQQNTTHVLHTIYPPSRCDAVITHALLFFSWLDRRYSGPMMAIDVAGAAATAALGRFGQHLRGSDLAGGGGVRGAVAEGLDLGAGRRRRGFAVDALLHDASAACRHG